jgi:hypothetical protein
VIPSCKKIDSSIRRDTKLIAENFTPFCNDKNKDCKTFYYYFKAGKTLFYNQMVLLNGISFLAV